MINILLGTGFSFRTHTLKEIEEVALHLGYAGVEYMPPPRHEKPENQQRDINYQVLKKIRVVHAPTDFYDQDKFKQSLSQAVEISKAIGNPLINIHPASLAFGGRDNVRWSMEYIRQVETETGLSIACEVLVNPAGLEPKRFDRMQKQQSHQHPRDWVEDIKEFGLKATIDTTHLASWSEDPTRYINILGSHLVHVHISDYSSKMLKEHLVPGEGDIDLRIFLQALQKSNPSITATVELQPMTTKKEAESTAELSLGHIHAALDKTVIDNLNQNSTHLTSAIL